MSSRQKGKTKHYEDVLGHRDKDEHREGLGEVCESSDSDAPPAALGIRKKKKKKKKAPTNQETTDLLSPGAIMIMAGDNNTDPTASSEAMLEGVDDYAHFGAERFSEVDPTFQRTLNELDADRTERLRRTQIRVASRADRDDMEQEEVFQDAFQTLTNADCFPSEQGVPVAVMVDTAAGKADEHEAIVRAGTSSSIVDDQLVDTETPPTTPPTVAAKPKEDWKRLPVKTVTMFRKADFMSTDPMEGDQEDGTDELDDAHENEALLDQTTTRQLRPRMEPVVELAKTRKRGRPSKADKLEERNAKKAKRQTELNSAGANRSDHLLRSRKKENESAPTPPRARGRPAKVVDLTGKDAPTTTSRHGRTPKETIKNNQKASSRLLSPMRAARKAAKSATNTAAAGKGGPVTRTKSHESDPIIGKSSLRSATKDDTQKDPKNGRKTLKKQKQSNINKTVETENTSPAIKPKTRYVPKIGTGMGRRRKRRGVCWTSKKSKKNQQPTGSGKTKVVVIVNDKFDRSEYVNCDHLVVD